MEVLQACYILLYRLQKNANVCWSAPFLNTRISLPAFEIRVRTFYYFRFFKLKTRFRKI